MKRKAAIQKARQRPGNPRISRKEVTRLQNELHEAQETLAAIRRGEVDAVVVQGPHGNRIYSLTGADQPYRVYIEQMQEGAATITDDGLILYANRRFADMVNQPLERVISANAAAYLNAGAWENIHSVFRKRQDVVKCETVLKPDGRAPLPVNLTASPLPLEGQTVLCLVVTDLSAQKQNEQLRLAKEVAERANVAKDNFLATLSHELRTPLNPVLLLASESAEDPALPPAVRASFETIRRNVELEARLIDDLLDLTRVSSGKLKLEKREVNIHLLLKAAVSLIQNEFGEKKIALKQKFDAVQNIIFGDEVRLQQVFWNILTNAMKFTPPGGSVTIETRSAHNECEVTISDTGLGLTPEELKRVFDAFVQGEHSADARRFGGLGLGLTISKKLVEMHSGSIEAVSKGRHRGAAFTVRFPLPQQNELPVRRDFSSPPERLSKFPGLRILLVEDHEPTRNTLAGLLSRRGNRVAMAISGREALALVNENNFDVVISDIGLPDGNGYDLFQKLRKQSPSIKGIALTGYGTDNDRARSEHSGFDAHLVKPVQIRELETALKTTMSF